MVTPAQFMELSEYLAALPAPIVPDGGGKTLTLEGAEIKATSFANQVSGAVIPCGIVTCLNIQNTSDGRLVRWSDQPGVVASGGPGVLTDWADYTEETATELPTAKAIGDHVESAIGWTAISGVAATPASKLYVGNSFKTPASWATGVAKSANDVVLPTISNGYHYVTYGAGTTDGATEPTWPTTEGATVVDNDITWVCRKCNTLAVANSSASGLTVGYPIKLVTDLGTYLGVIVAKDTPGETTTNVAFMGGTIPTTETITSAFVGVPGMVVEKDYRISGVYATATTTTALADSGQADRLCLPNLTAVGLRLKHTKNDTSGSMTINTSIGGTNLLALGVAPTTAWARPSEANIQQAVEFDDDVEISCTTSSSPADAENLAVALTFIRNS